MKKQIIGLGLIILSVLFITNNTRAFTTGVLSPLQSDSGTYTTWNIIGTGITGANCANGGNYISTNNKHKCYLSVVRFFPCFYFRL